MSADVCPVCHRASLAERQELGGLCPGCLLDLAGARAAEDGVAEPPPLEPGTLFRALAVEALLGRGGMGFVYRARHVGLDRPFALKILSPQLAGRTGFAERFVREARTMAALDHPRIVRITDFGVEQGLYFIVMEYVEGTTLRQRMGQGRVPLGEGLAIALDLCDALAAAHARGIIHRDIKPENILLDGRGRARVTDFGLAKALAGGERAALTRTSAVMGTVRYMAPEQLEEMAVDRRADIFSLGAVLYELFTGDVPRGPSPPPSRLGRHLDRIVLRCLDPAPSGRPASAREVRRALERSLRRFQPAARRLRAPALAVVLAGTAGALGVAFGVRGAGPPVSRNVPGLWEALGHGVSNGHSRQPALALDRQGRAVVAWVAESGQGTHVDVARWDGGVWQDLAGSSTASGRSRAPSVALDRQDNPVVVWAEDHGVWLRWYREGRWQGLGGSDENGGLSGLADRVDWPSVALDGRGQPVVAWCHGNRIFVRHFADGAWRERDGSASGDGLSGALSGECRPSLALDSAGQPWVAWTRSEEGDKESGELLVRRWDGARWLTVAVGGEGRRARSVRLALTPQDRPVLAWREMEPRARRSWIMVMAWDGHAWRELGGSARGRGLVSEGSSAYRPDLAIDREGHLVVVWNALIGPWPEHEIFAKKWDGERWTELAGSGSGNGLSAARGDSGGAAIALDVHGRPTVAWTEAAARKADILVRRFVPARGD